MDRKPVQAASASQEFRQRMKDARADLPESVGQSDVIKFIIDLAPHLDSLTNLPRWHNAWNKRVADPELTDLVEKAVIHFKAIKNKSANRLSGQKLKKVK